MGKAGTIVTPPIQCKECGCDRWFRVVKGILKAERVYACQDCGYRVKGRFKEVNK